MAVAGLLKVLQAFWMSCRPTKSVTGLLNELQALWGLLDELMDECLLDELNLLS